MLWTAVFGKGESFDLYILNCLASVKRGLLEPEMLKANLLFMPSPQCHSNLFLFPVDFVENPCKLFHHLC